MIEKRRHDTTAQDRISLAKCTTSHDTKLASDDHRFFINVRVTPAVIAKRGAESCRNVARFAPCALLAKSLVRAMQREHAADEHSM